MLKSSKKKINQFRTQLNDDFRIGQVTSVFSMLMVMLSIFVLIFQKQEVLFPYEEFMDFVFLTCFIILILVPAATLPRLLVSVFRTKFTAEQYYKKYPINMFTRYSEVKNFSIIVSILLIGVSAIAVILFRFDLLDETERTMTIIIILGLLSIFVHTAITDVLYLGRRRWFYFTKSVLTVDPNDTELRKIRRIDRGLMLYNNHLRISKMPLLNSRLLIEIIAREDKDVNDIITQVNKTLETDSLKTFRYFFIDIGNKKSEILLKNPKGENTFDSVLDSSTKIIKIIQALLVPIGTILAIIIKLMF